MILSPITVSRGSGIRDRATYDADFPPQGVEDSSSGSGCLVILDIDRLIGYNDQHGPMQGDLLIIQLISFVAVAVRENEATAYHIGPDDFAIFAPSESVALAAAKVVIHAMSALPWSRYTFRSCTPLRPVTLSVGMATNCPTRAQLRLRAEYAWAFAKKQGGHCLIGHQADTWNGEPPQYD
jgi:GGDEF domain-containing protein